MVSDVNFVTAWATSGSLDGVADKTGLAKSTIRDRGNRLRKAGVKLPRFSRPSAATVAKVRRYWGCDRFAKHGIQAVGVHNTLAYLRNTGENVDKYLAKRGPTIAQQVAEPYRDQLEEVISDVCDAKTAKVYVKKGLALWAERYCNRPCNDKGVRDTLAAWFGESTGRADYICREGFKTWITDPDRALKNVDFVDFLLAIVFSLLPQEGLWD
jgi:hypothetical protein